MKTKTRIGRMLAVLLTLTLALGMSPMMSQAAVAWDDVVKAVTVSNAHVFVPGEGGTGGNFYDVYYTYERLTDGKFDLVIETKAEATVSATVPEDSNVTVKQPVKDLTTNQYTIEVDVNGIVRDRTSLASPYKHYITVSVDDAQMIIRMIPTGRIGYWVDKSGVSNGGYVNIGGDKDLWNKSGGSVSITAATHETNKKKGGWLYDMEDKIVIAIKPDAGKLIASVAVHAYYGSESKLANLTEWVPQDDSTIRYTDANTPLTYADAKVAGETWYLFEDMESDDYYIKVMFKDPDAPPVYIPPVIGGGGSTSEGGSSSETGEDVEGGSSSGEASPEDITIDEAIAAAEAAAEAAADDGEDSAVVKFKNPAEIAVESFQAMVEAADVELMIHADSMNGNAVDVRIYVDPSLATQDMNLSASTVSDDAMAVTEFFEKYFENDLFGVSLGQKDSYGMTVRIAAKLPAEMETDNLYFYVYNSETNQYSRIKAPAYRVDKNGYVHFDTDMGGDIIISDGPLKKP